VRRRIWETRNTHSFTLVASPARAAAHSAVRPSASGWFTSAPAAV
jgi:hypothetical protein